MTGRQAARVDVGRRLGSRWEALLATSPARSGGLAAAQMMYTGVPTGVLL
jgi:hypothetical protein